MNKFKMYALKKVEYSFTGKNVLSSIQDKDTPGVDLLIREVIQNMTDVITEEYGKIDFKYDQFDINKFKTFFDLEQLKNVDEAFQNVSNSFLSIKDSNCSGLTGTPYCINGKRSNLYSLVYDMMKGKDSFDATSGGSWGIGKSVYYRYNNGFVFYYTKTYEDGEYHEKLIGTLIEDDDNAKRLTPLNSRGIAFFGSEYDNEHNCMNPFIDNIETINEFLSIFGIERYKENETGTTLIIPFFNEELFLSHSINCESAYWKFDIKEAIKQSIQRWYFPRINNTSFKGKTFYAFVNGEQVELKKFYKLLQALYCGKIGTQYPIKHRQITCQLGTLNYMLFTPDLLDVDTPPNNEPNPYIQLDINNEEAVNNQAIIATTRSPGMIISYNNSGIGEDIFVKENEYLIGIFVLNDDGEANNEKLGEYIRQTEPANHKSWNDSNIKNFPYFSSKNPTKKIKNLISSKLKNEFKIDTKITFESNNTLLQKKLASILLPEHGVENGNAEIQRRKKTEKKQKVISKKSKKKSEIQCEILQNGTIEYEIMVRLDPLEKIKITFDVQADTRIFSYSKWIDYGYNIPSILDSLLLVSLYSEEANINNVYNSLYLFKDKLKNTLSLTKTINNEKHKIISFNGLYKNDIPYGIIIENQNNSPIILNIILKASILDSSFDINLNTVYIKQKKEN